MESFSEKSSLAKVMALTAQEVAKNGSTILSLEKPSFLW